MATDQKPNSITETIKTIIYALLIAGVIRSLFFQPFWIPSSSMKPTLLIGDFLFVNKMAYGYSRYSCPWGLCPFSGRIWPAQPKRGDIVVFKHPTTKVDFIKRAVGLPGDKVQMKNGVLHINGDALVQTPNGTFNEIKAQQGPLKGMPRCSNEPVGFGTNCEKQQLRETLPNEKSYQVLNIGETFTDNTPLYTVPEGHFFFMGDNRDNSGDSRMPANIGGVGFVPFDHLIGRADRVIFSSAGARILYFWTWRSDRFFVGLN